jgi:adenylosuccinate synthase
VEPIYETLPGWDEDISDLRHFAELPTEARDYLMFVADYIGVEISMVSIGPKRQQIITDLEAQMPAA